MLTEYIQAAMRRACYQILLDGTFYGEVPELQGVWADAKTLEECRKELQEVVEEWIVFGLSRNLPLPPLDGIAVAIQRVA